VNGFRENCFGLRFAILPGWCAYVAEVLCAPAGRQPFTRTLELDRMTLAFAAHAVEGIAVGSDPGYLAHDAESRAQGRAKGMAAFLRFVDEAVDSAPEKPPVEALVERTKRAKTTFRQRQVTRIVNGIKASKATGTFEFLLDDDLVRFRLAGESDAPVKPAEKVNPWDKVLKNGKAKPPLTLLKKVP
jgi:hypothetical protein